MLLVPWILASAVACSGADQADSGEKQQPDNGQATVEDRCASSADCASGDGCLLPAGVCVPYSTQAQTFTIAVDPRDGSGLIPDQFASFPVGTGGQLNLTVVEPLTVRGVVAFGAQTTGLSPGAAGADLVSGRLVATAPGYVPGTVLRSEAAVSPSVSGDAQAPWTFELKVVPGLPWAYDVVFLPDARPTDPDLPDLPPFRFQARFTSGRYDVLLPGRGEYTKVSGRVVFQDAGGFPGVAGARVTAVGTEDAAGQQPTSSNAETDADGDFTVVLLAKGPIVLRVEPGQKSKLFHPRQFDLAPSAAWDSQKVNDIANATLDLGPVPATREMAVQVLDETLTTPVATALLQATTADGISVAAVTGSSGVARLDLLDGAYRVAVLPPPESPYAAAYADLDVSENASPNRMLLLAKRPVIDGKVVRHATGAGVGGALVTLSTNHLPALNDVSLGLQDESFSVVTAADGTFRVAVDAAPYALSVVPPSASGLPRYSQPVIDLTGGDKLVTVPLPEGALVFGTVTRASTDPGSGKVGAVPVPDAQVRFFYEVAAGASVADLWSTSQEATFAAAVQVAGAARTASDGTYTAVVPVLVQVDGKFGGSGPVPGENGADAGTAASFGLPDTDVDSL